MILVYHFILSTNEIFAVSYGTGYQSTYLATNNSKVPFFLPTVCTIKKTTPRSSESLEEKEISKSKTIIYKHFAK